MSSEWQIGKLGDFIELKRGYDLPQAKRNTGSIPLLSSSGLSDYHDQAMVKGPGVVTGRYGTIGQVFFVEGDFWPLNTTLYVRDFKGNDPKFIHYFLKTVDFFAYSDKAAVPGINRNHLHEARAKLPPVAIQKKIAAFLGALDDRIALLRETNTTLETIAQALFKSWFVDFDPVHANAARAAAEGQQAGATPAASQPDTDPQAQRAPLPPDLAALFPDTFEDTELGPVPKGWQIGSLESIAEILNGFAFKSEDYIEDENAVFVLRTTNFNSEGYATRLDKDVFLPNSFLTSHKRFTCQPFDFHLVMVGASVGNTSLLLPHLLPALRNQNMWCFRPKPNFPSKFFIHETVKINAAEALRSTSGSAREFLRKGDFGLRKVIFPPTNILIIFEEYVQTIKEHIANNAAKSQTLATLRDTLLPRLISGQLRLPEVDANFLEAIT